MPKLIDDVKTYWGHIVVALMAIAALVVSVSGNNMAKTACQANKTCAAQYAAGEAISPTTVNLP